MDAIIKLAYIFTDLFLPLMLGYLFRRKNWLSEEYCNQMIVVNIWLVCTALSVLSFWALPLKWELVWLPLFGILLSFIPGITAYWISGNKYETGLERGSYLASATLSNIGSLGGLCAFILFGEPGFAYTQIVALFQNLVLLLFCFPMAQYYRQSSLNEDAETPPITFSSLFLNRNQLPVAGMVAGMILYLGDVPRPQFLGDMFSLLIHFSAWMALIPVGYSIDFAAMKHYYGSILDLIPIKFGITPLLGYLLARHLFSDPLVFDTILVLASVPTGINAVVTARLYALNLHVAGAAFVLTTGVFLVVVYPLLFLWFTMAH
jgi:predicted permease